MISDLRIRGEKDTPEIDFNGNGYFTMSGRSIPEDCDEFYQPICDYIERFIHYGEQLIFNFDLDYYNTMSLRYLSKIFSLINEMNKKGKAVMVNWYHRKNDEDMLDIGKDFKKIYKFKKFNILQK
jgi:hypothetical protein